MWKLLEKQTGLRSELRTPKKQTVIARQFAKVDCRGNLTNIQP